MPPTVAFVLGVLVGLAVGAVVVTGLVRSTARITGARPRGLPSLVLAGLVPGARTDGVAAQRALARRLTGTASRSASGRLIGASAVVLHVSPEDHRLLEDTIGIERATADLNEFYIAHARRRKWHLVAHPVVTIERDISLRPRQAFAHAETHATDGDAAEAPEPHPVAAPRPRTAPVRLPERPPRDEAPESQPDPDDAVTDVLPRSALEAALAEADANPTSTYPIGPGEALAPGDLVVVHGTDVRTVPAARGSASIGRGAHNDVVVDAPGVARDHVVVERRDTGWWVVPRGVAAKTLIDGRRLDAAAAVDGQAVLQLGRGARVRLTVEPAA